MDELRFGHLPPDTAHQLSLQEVVPPKLHHNVTVLTAHITGLPAVDDTTVLEVTRCVDRVGIVSHCQMREHELEYSGAISNFGQVRSLAVAPVYLLGWIFVSQVFAHLQHG